MEFILIRHAQSEHNTGESKNLDSSLTQAGKHQAKELAEFLEKQSVGDFIGLVSPYARALETAFNIYSRTKIPFLVTGGVREYHLDKQASSLPELGGINIPNRRSIFRYFSWPYDQFPTRSIFYPNETLDEFIGRIDLFLNRLQDMNYIIVSHGAPTRVMHDILTGKDLNYLKTRYSEEQECLRCEPSSKENSIGNSSVTHIVDGKTKVFAGIVNETLFSLDTNQGGQRK